MDDPRTAIHVYAPASENDPRSEPDIPGVVVRRGPLHMLDRVIAEFCP